MWLGTDAVVQVAETCASLRDAKTAAGLWRLYQSAVAAGTLDAADGHGRAHDAMVAALHSGTSRADARIGLEALMEVDDDLAQRHIQLPMPSYLRLARALAAVGPTRASDVPAGGSEPTQDVVTRRLVGVLRRCYAAAGPLTAADAEPLAEDLARRVPATAASVTDNGETVLTPPSPFHLADVIDALVAATATQDSRAHQGILTGARGDRGKVWRHVARRTDWDCDVWTVGTRTNPLALIRAGHADEAWFLYERQRPHMQLNSYGVAAVLTSVCRHDGSAHALTQFTNAVRAAAARWHRRREHAQRHGLTALAKK